MLCYILDIRSFFLSYSLFFYYSPSVSIPLPYQSCSALVSPSISLWRFNNYDLNQSKCLQQCSQGCFAKDSQITRFCNYHKEQLTLLCKCTTLASAAVYFLYCISSFLYSFLYCYLLPFIMIQIRTYAAQFILHLELLSLF